MTVLNIATLPDPVLKRAAGPVADITGDIRRLAGDLVDTLRHHPRCVGIAAPQVFKSLRLIAVDLSRYSKPHPHHGLIVLANPVVLVAEGRIRGREGCLSVPDLTGNVSRAEKIAVEGLTLDGATMRIETAGFEAVVLQHEIDHLDGILFLDRVTSLKTDVFRRKNQPGTEVT